MIFDNAKLMSCSFLHQQHQKCASFVYSATEIEGAEWGCGGEAVG